VTQRPPGGQPPVSWQIHFASFNRIKGNGSLVAERVLDVEASHSGLRWSTGLHAVGHDWVVHYPLWQQEEEPLAIFKLVDSQGNTLSEQVPFTLSADSLGSSVHSASGQVGRIGISVGANDSQGSRISFRVLEPPACH
jgi:hypothetical protein